MSELQDRMAKVAEACTNATAAFDPNLYWWDAFWTAVGIGGFMLLVAACLGALIAAAVYS